jgi:protein-tyrosine phosphatase
MRISAIVTVALLVAGSGIVFAAPSPEAASSSSLPRAVHLEGAPNFRDLGGYHTRDGLVIRWGQVYRSNKLSALSSQDVEQLRGLQIGSLIDFRAADERAAEPDRFLPPYVYRSAKPSIKPAMKTIMGRRRNASDVRSGMRRFYSEMPFSYAPEFSAMLHRLAASDEPLVMHCTAGKDRTGVAAAILLSLLGVPRGDVISDYTRTAQLLPRNIAAVSPKTRNVPPLPVSMQQALLAAEPDYITNALSAIDRRYGSVNDYAGRLLGVRPQEIQAIRSRLLVRPPA